METSNSVVPRPVARGCWGCDAPPKSAKRSTFSHIMGQKLGFWWRVKGVRFKKSTFWVQKVHFFGVPHPSKIDPGYGPGCTFNQKRLINGTFNKNVYIIQICFCHTLSRPKELYVILFVKHILIFLSFHLSICHIKGRWMGCA